jgi:hypothetical protein
MPTKKVQIRMPKIRDDQVVWFGGKPMSVANNIKWSNAVKRDSKKNLPLYSNLITLAPIKGRKRVNEVSLLQNLNSSLDLNPFPISKVQEAKNENDLVERQSGARRLRPLTKPRSSLQSQTGGRYVTQSKPKVGGSKKRVTKRK